MRFDEALERNPAPQSVGDIILHYDAPVLVGRSRRTGRSHALLPDVFYVLAAAAGVGVLATLVTRGDALAQALILTGLSAAFAAAGMRLERRAHAARRFILHFGDEQLRLEVPTGRSRRMRSLTVPFDDVREVFVQQGDRQDWQLYVTFAVMPGAAETMEVLLVDRVREDEVEALQRLWTTLRSAFGIRSPAAE